MKKRFVVMLDSSTQEQNQAFLAFIQNQSLNWWHWLTNSWLIIGANVSADEISAKVQQIYPNIHHLVIELRTDGTEEWYGFGPSGEKRNMFPWLQQYWKKHG